MGGLENKIPAGKENLDRLVALGIGEGIEEETMPWSLDGLHHLRELLDSHGIAYVWHDFDGDMYVMQSRLGDEIMPFFAENLTFE